ncbi:glutathione S-transferase family protein [Methylibium sp.]|uniref:glutathione S-transferase family protein n=1 Tax=Methylibium sp. TaxID=2067992 RepID=UPI0017E870A4|nr:glutathione S-transferase family protein [Methylibium sp.]MBA3588351.1 glutathione S-transferase family protein [Methylibium sp.]
MSTSRHVTFFHALNSRSVVARVLLEELGADYDVHLLDLQAGTQREPAYLAVNPMGKVPAIRHGDAVVTEQGAVYLYLAELYPEAGLAPPVGDPMRGPFLRWLFFYGSCFEPAVVDRSMQREPAPVATSPYGDFDTTLGTLTAQLRAGPWLLGERFSAADVLWAGALQWTTMFKLVPELPEIAAYIARFNARPAVARARAKDAELAGSTG